MKPGGIGPCSQRTRDRTGEHGLKLQQVRFRLDTRKKFFTELAIGRGCQGRYWNHCFRRCWRCLGVAGWGVVWLTRWGSVRLDSMLSGLFQPECFRESATLPLLSVSHTGGLSSTAWLPALSVSSVWFYEAIQLYRWPQETLWEATVCEHSERPGTEGWACSCPGTGGALRTLCRGTHAGRQRQLLLLLSEKGH